MISSRLNLRFALALAAVICIIETGQAQTSTEVSGWAWWETGQIVKAKYLGQDYEHAWMHNAFVNISLKRVISPRLTFLAGLEGQMWFNSIDLSRNRLPDFVPGKNLTFYLTQAEGVYTAGDLNKSWLQAELGIFRFKYNQEARNLGEYMFRTGVYPGWVMNNFDFPLAQLSGIKLSGGLFGCLRQDLLLSVETDYPPYFDWTATYLAAYKPGKFAEIGLGAQLSHFLSVNDTLTTPKKISNYYLKNQRTLPNGDSAADTGYYTFQGTKLMARVMFDPKGLFSWDFFGPEDLKLYAEAIILGVENYPVYFDTLWQRIPVMFGFHLPTFKALDVVAIEAEWYGCRYPNSFANIYLMNQNTPTPALPVGDYVLYNYRNDNWKWSVYAKKTVFSNVAFVAQAARDHVFSRSSYTYYIDREEALTKNDNWYWMAKVQYAF